MSKLREDFHNLPPIARAAAMHRPYRPGRRPLFYALLATLAVHLVWGAWALFSPRKLPPPAPRKPPVAEAGIVYTTPIQAAPRPAEPAAQSKP